jgi:hypothetical protein
MEPGVMETRPSARYLRRFALVYVLFGIAYLITECVYSNYRAAAGNPSDLPVWMFPWAPMILACWPLFAFANLTGGDAVMLPEVFVRAWGFVFLAGFLAVMWLFRNRSPNSSGSATP